MAQSLLRVFGHQGFEFGLGSLMVEKSETRRAEETRGFRPRIGLAHIDEPNRFDPGPRGLDAERIRGLAGLDAAPEFALRRDKEMLVERIGGYGYFNP